jgi:hypothetical protein
MTVCELTRRVTATAAAVALPLAVAGAWLGGRDAVVGVLAGAALAVWSFRRLAARASGGAAPGVAWMVTAGLRFVAVASAAGLLLALGWAHPVAVLAGYSVLPVVVVVHGLRLAKETPSWT